MDRRIGATLLLACLLAGLPAGLASHRSAGADTVDGEGNYGPDTAWVRAWFHSDGSSASATSTASTTSRFRAERLVTTTCLFPVDGGSPIPNPGIQSPDEVTVDPAVYEVGIFYQDAIIDTATGTSVSVRGGCVRPGASPPPPIEDPPAPAAVYDSVELPTPSIGISPDIPITGMETYMWASGAIDERRVGVTIGSWTAQVGVRPVGYIWHPGDGTRIVGQGPGSPCRHPSCKSQVSARHTYEKKGDLDLRLQTWWTGEFTLSGYGITLAADDLGERVSETSAPVHVIEVRSVVDLPPGDPRRRP